MIKIIKLIFLLLISINSFSQDFINIPKIFNGQFQANILKEIESNSSFFEKIVNKSDVDNYWVVYSDRDGNFFYDQANGSKKNEKAEFLQGFLVSEVKGHWLHLFDLINFEDMGWVKSSNLILSQYSLLTDANIEKGEISIPRKAIILTNIENVNSSNNKKYYYKHPDLSSRFRYGSPMKFQSLFVFKESKNAVLLGVSDNIGSQGTNKSSKIHGWINKKDIENWNTRVALENSNTDEAKEIYGDNTFNGYRTKKELKLCLEQQTCSEKTSFVEIKIGPTRNNEMRRPILSTINENIFQVVSVLGDKEGSKEKESKLEKSRKLQEKVNIVFVLDATASMRPYYKSIANSLESVIDNNQKITGSSLRVGVVIYRDYLDEKKSYDALRLSTDYNKTKEYINGIKCHSKDSDLPEAQYNGLINGLSKVGLKKGESNIIVLVGDCGNHLQDDKGYELKEVINLYDKYDCNVISFQVDSKNDYTYYKFNKDVLKTIKSTAEKRLMNLDINVRFKKDKNNSIKLFMTEDGVEYY